MLGASWDGDARAGQTQTDRVSPRVSARFQPPGHISTNVWAHAK